MKKMSALQWGLLPFRLLDNKIGTILKLVFSIWLVVSGWAQRRMKMLGNVGDLGTSD